ncbi:MAG: fasciclin domain-containing protein [Bacteroidales bacterium]|nr:fasciclin domain-containing protein [Bacteroidales bacterium]
MTDRYLKKLTELKYKPMKNNQLQLIERSIKWFSVFVLIFILSSCREAADELPARSSGLQIAEYVAINPDAKFEFTEFDKIIRETQIRGLLNSSGPFTLLLPTNEAIFEFYQSKGIGSYADMDTAALRALVMNHIIPGEIETTNIPVGTFPNPNAIGDFIVTEYVGSEIILNKYARIIDRDVYNLNGITHVIDKVLEPLSKSVFQVLSDNPEYSIFTNALVKAGLSDTLNILTIPYGQKQRRTRYTILAVHDSIFQNQGINNVDDLVERYSNGDNNLTNLNNGFYRYVEYHCLENTYFLSNFDARGNNYSVLSADNYVNIRVTNDYQINYSSETDTFASFYEEYANIPAKNGVIHPINNLLPVTEPKPVEITFEVTDYYDIKEEEFYLKHYKRFFDGENQFKYVKWKADFLLYYFKVPGVNSTQGDCWQLNGFFWIEVTTPKIMKGKYTVSIGGLQADHSPDMVAYIDDVRCETILTFRNSQWQFIDFLLLKLSLQKQLSIRFF